MLPIWKDRDAANLLMQLYWAISTRDLAQFAEVLSRRNDWTASQTKRLWKRVKSSQFFGTCHYEVEKDKRLPVQEDFFDVLRHSTVTMRASS
jgi:hypothetical protein